MNWILDYAIAGFCVFMFLVLLTGVWLMLIVEAEPNQDRDYGGSADG